VFAAKFVPGIPPLNAIVGAAISYVIISVVVKSTTRQKTTGDMKKVS
jgi:cytosine permease